MFLNQEESGEEEEEYEEYTDEEGSGKETYEESPRGIGTSG